MRRKAAKEGGKSEMQRGVTMIEAIMDPQIAKAIQAIRKRKPYLASYLVMGKYKLIEDGEVIIDFWGNSFLSDLVKRHLEYTELEFSKQFRRDIFISILDDDQLRGGS